MPPYDIFAQDKRDMTREQNYVLQAARRSIGFMWDSKIPCGCTDGIKPISTPLFKIVSYRCRAFVGIRAARCLANVVNVFAWVVVGTFQATPKEALEREADAHILLHYLSAF